MGVDEGKLNELLGKMVGDLGAAVSGALVVVGDRLGLYEALAETGPATSAQLAERTGTTERYVREWLAAQAASGYVEYDAGEQKFEMTPEQVAVFADKASPALMTGGYYCVAAGYIDEPKVTEAFRTGEGIPWGDHHPNQFCGGEMFFKPLYIANLLSSWIPALEGVQEKLARGGKVADVGCGHGVSTRIMAKAFPNSTFVGFDVHEPSIEVARATGREEGLDNLEFEVATAKNFPGSGYDMVAFFDCLHDMGDPVGASEHVLQSLDSDGTWLIVEPFAHDTLEENLNPVGRLYYPFSVLLCTPSSLSQEVGLALGGQAGEKRLHEVVTTAGFTRFRRATETPFNLILEARP